MGHIDVAYFAQNYFINNLLKLVTFSLDMLYIFVCVCVCLYGRDLEIAFHMG